jgi:hypothetical protein
MQVPVLPIPSCSRSKVAASAGQAINPVRRNSAVSRYRSEHRFDGAHIQREGDRFTCCRPWRPGTQATCWCTPPTDPVPAPGGLSARVRHGPSQGELTAPSSAPDRRAVATMPAWPPNTSARPAWSSASGPGRPTQPQGRGSASSGAPAPRGCSPHRGGHVRRCLRKAMLLKSGAGGRADRPAHAWSRVSGHLAYRLRNRGRTAPVWRTPDPFGECRRRLVGNGIPSATRTLRRESVTVCTRPSALGRVLPQSPASHHP